MRRNYLHAGLRSVPEEFLGRRPTATHLAIYERLRALLAACHRPDNHAMPPGRSVHEFIARLIELDRFAEQEEILNPDPYSCGAEEKPAPSTVFGGFKTCTDSRQLRGFLLFSHTEPLDPSRLKLSGDGQWPLADFLEDILCFIFKSPWCFNMDSGSIGMALTSSMNQPARMSAFVAFGMLVVSLPFSLSHPIQIAAVASSMRTRTQQQTGRLETGGGSMAQNTTLRATNRKLIGLASDRKDFYHQAKVTRQRAASNCLPFSFPRFCCFSGIHSLKRSLDQFLEKPMVTDMV